MQIIFAILALILSSTISFGSEFPLADIPTLSEAEDVFRRGMVLESSDPKEARTIYKELLNRKTGFEDALHWALARLADGAEAAGHWRSVVETDPASPFLADGLRGLARYALKRGKLNEAESLLRKLAKLQTGEEERAKTLGELLGVYERAKNRGALLRLGEILFVEYAHLPESGLGERILEERGVGNPFKPMTARRILERGMTLMKRGSRREAAVTLEYLRGKLLRGSKIEPELDLALGETLYMMRRYEDALAPLKRAAGYPAQEEKARFLLARTLFGLNRGNVGAADLVKLAAEFPNSSRAPLYLYQAERVFTGRRMHDEASGAAKKLLGKYPSSAEGVEVRWNRGWSHYLMGRYEDAQSQWQKGSELAANGWYLARSDYWRGKAHLNSGRVAEGEKLLKELARRHPVGYYARLAKGVLSKKTEVLGLVDPRAADGSLTPPKPGAELAVEDGPLARPALYIRLGLPEAAKRLLRAPEFKTRKAEKLDEARLRFWAEDFHGALNIAGLGWSSLSGGGGIEPFSREGLSFPLAYPGSVNSAAQVEGLHPHLLLAIGRTESHFFERGYSNSEARGVMQFIPPTAREVAERLGMKGFQQEDLYDPEVSLRFGANYLKRLLDRFDGNLISAAASYNGGAGAVSKWRKKHPNVDEDVFVELIPYKETRRYVKKVLTALDAYSKIDSPGLWPE